MQIPYRKPGKFSQLPVDPVLTSGKFAELQHNLDRLKNTVRPELAAEVARLAELGDFSENAEYQLAKGKLRGVNNRILSLESRINRAVIINPEKNSGFVQLGHTVTIFSLAGEKKYQILGSSETKPGQGIISHNSPVGAALLGRTVGEKVIIKLGNKEVEYEIRKIE